MHQVIEALVDEAGRVFLVEPVRFLEKRRALVIVLDDTPPWTRFAQGASSRIPRQLKTGVDTGLTGHLGPGEWARRSSAPTVRRAGPSASSGSALTCAVRFL